MLENAIFCLSSTAAQVWAAVVVFLTCKDIFYFVIGIVFGLIAGIAIYWAPLGQFCNEWKALWNLVKKRFNRGDTVSIRSGTDLTPVMAAAILTVMSNTLMTVWHDEGVGWFHTSSGWKRARVIQVFQKNDPTNTLYRTCHLDIEC